MCPSDMRRDMRGLFLVPLVAATILLAGEYPLPEKPLSVERLPLRDVDKELTFINWGSVGPSVRRRPDRVAEEVAGLRRWITSPEFISELMAFQQGVQDKVAPYLEKRMAAFLQDYQTRERRTILPTMAPLRESRYPIPESMWSMPIEMRRMCRYLIIDDRDPRQRAFAEAVYASDQVDGRQTWGVAIAWTSGSNRDEYWGSRNRGMRGLADDYYPAYFGVDTLPAVITYSHDGMTVIREEGLPLELLHANEGRAGAKPFTYSAPDASREPVVP